MKTLSILILIVLTGCTSQEPPEVFEFDGLDNVQVFPSEASLDTLLLTKDKTFGDTEDVLFASMGMFTVDDSGRVYIADVGWGSRSLHVFNPDGSYLKKIAGEGRGPAEFLSLSNLQYHSGRILFYDSQLQRIMIYSTTSLKPIKTVLTDSQKWQDMEVFQGNAPMNTIWNRVLQLLRLLSYHQV
ncbi:6-bladed beta-propeller [Gracilimonas sp.]|uniref:6-bladed beta-propeller n=1 Tax=Gracilimonas sp. TaxID=1974203 RepID=UPI002871534A|nr:6-bladed beta-propeller [Gracilimonas sp.]